MDLWILIRERGDTTLRAYEEDSHRRDYSKRTHEAAHVGVADLILKARAAAGLSQAQARYED